MPASAADRPRIREDDRKEDRDRPVLLVKGGGPLRLLRSLGAVLCIAAGVAAPDRASFPWHGNAAALAPELAGAVTSVPYGTQAYAQGAFESEAAAWGVATCWIDASAASNSLQPEVDPDGPGAQALCPVDRLRMDRDTALSVVDVQAILPSGNPYGPITEGVYYFAIARAFADPDDSDSLLLAADSRGPTLHDAATSPAWLASVDVWEREYPFEGADDRDRARFEASESASALAGETAPDPATLSSLLVAALGLIAWRRGAD